MEEDIKILEERIKENRSLPEEIGVFMFLDGKTMQVIEHLIKEYKKKDRQIEQLETEKQNVMKDLEEVSHSLEKDGFVGYADDIQDILSYMKGEEK